MTDLNKALQFKDLMHHALKSKWCVKALCPICEHLFCPTCGSLEFRSGSLEFRNGLNKFSLEDIVEGLKILPADFMELEEATDTILYAFLYASTLNSSGSDLREALKGTPSLLALQKAIDFNRKQGILRRDDNKQYALYEKQNRLDFMKISAQKNIWGAIKRKDIKAVKALIDKGINLNEKNEDGKSVKDFLIELNFYE